MFDFNECDDFIDFRVAHVKKKKHLHYENML